MADMVLAGDWVSEGWAFASHLLAGAIGGAVCGSVLQHFFQRRRYFSEQLMVKYSELVGVASAEIDRAKSVEAVFKTCNPSQDEGSRAFLRKLYEERDTFRRDLARLCMQIQLLETNSDLALKVKELAKAQPFFLGGGWYGDGNFNERMEKYEEEIRTYERLLDTLKTGSSGVARS